MTRKQTAAIAFCLSLFTCMHAQAQPGKTSNTYDTSTTESRGEMLYSVSCSSCHAAEVHWRVKKLATSPERLQKEVQRWKNNIGVDWNNDDVNEVARYLDTAFYHFTAADKEKSSSGAANNPLQPQHQGDIRYISGGLSPEQRQAMRTIAKDYNLRLTFTNKAKGSDKFFSGIHISIIDAKQKNVLDAVANGPLFLASIPDGHYQLNIEKGGKHLSKSITIGKNRTVALSF